MAEAGQPHVLIIGAGLTGLLIAHGLNKAGIKYTIFEDEDYGAVRPREWTMGIHWALPLLEDLLPPHLAARIVKDGSVDGSLDYEKPPNNGAYIFDGVDGEILKDLTVSGRIVRVSRRKLRALCSRDIEVKHSHKLQTITYNDGNDGVTARFTNGESYSGSLLVGCDGPRSVVRSYLFSNDPTKGQAQPVDGIMNMSMAVSYADVETAKFVRETSHPVWCICISPDAFLFMSMQDVPDPNRPDSWRFFIMVSWPGEWDGSLDNAGRLQLLKNKASKLAEPFHTAILSVPDEIQVSYTELSSWIAQPWDTIRGRVTLAGDSGHPMPPWRGQGGNHAIQDAQNFVEAMKRIAAAAPDDRAESQANIIQEYSDEVAKRGAEETSLSIKNGRMMLAYDDFKESPYFKQGLSRG